jgi:hypothetical protein
MKPARIAFFIIFFLWLAPLAGKSAAHFNKQMYTTSVKAGRAVFFKKNAKSFIDPKASIWDVVTDIDMVGDGVSSDVYHVAGPDGADYAMKVFRPGRDWGQEKALMILKINASRMTKSSAQREFEMNLAAADHPHIIRIHHLVLKEERGITVPILLMEWVDGGTLGDHIQFGECLNPHKILTDYIGTLIYLLDQGVIPDDLHSRNVLIAEGEEIKLIDMAYWALQEEDHHIPVSQVLAGVWWLIEEIEDYQDSDIRSWARQLREAFEERFDPLETEMALELNEEGVTFLKAELLELREQLIEKGPVPVSPGDCVLNATPNSSSFAGAGTRCGTPQRVL